MLIFTDKVCSCEWLLRGCVDGVLMVIERVC